LAAEAKTNAHQKTMEEMARAWSGGGGGNKDWSAMRRDGLR
jgi:hypothetical protein